MEFPYLSVVILLISSAIFSASETSLLSLNRAHLQELNAKTKKGFRRVKYLLDRPTSLIATLLIGNEFANVILANTLARFYNGVFDSWITITVINLCTALPLIIVFGEITPRVLAARSNISASRMLIPIVWFLYRISLPLRLVIETFVNGVSRLMGVKHKTLDGLSESDFLTMLEDGKHLGAIAQSEHKLIENIFDLDDDSVKTIAIPIQDFFSVGRDEKVVDIIGKILEKKYPRIPVTGDFPNEIVGVLYTKDLLVYAHRPDEFVTVAHLMKDPVFIEPNMPIETLFKRMRQLRVHIAFTSPDEKSVDGVITMSLILEKIFGQLWQREDKRGLK